MIFAAIMVGAFVFLLVPTLPLVLSMRRIRRAEQGAATRAALSTDEVDEVLERAFEQHLEAERVRVRVSVPVLLGLVLVTVLALSMPMLLQSEMREEGLGEPPGWLRWAVLVIVLLTWLGLLLLWWVGEIMSTHRRAQGLVIEAGLKVEERGCRGPCSGQAPTRGRCPPRGARGVSRGAASAHVRVVFPWLCCG